MEIYMTFLNATEADKRPVFVPNVILREDQAALIPNSGDTLTGIDGVDRRVAGRKFRFNDNPHPGSVMVTILME